MAAKYLLIAQDLRNYIQTHQRIRAYKLPTEQELCAKYGVSRQTIRQALMLLEEENRITRIQGSGEQLPGPPIAIRPDGYEDRSDTWPQAFPVLSAIPSCRSARNAV